MATCSAVVLLSGEPKYFMTATMYPDYTGTFTINKLGLNGVRALGLCGMVLGNLPTKITNKETNIGGASAPPIFFLV